MRLGDLGRGDWRPSSTHPTLVAIQLLALWQAALRGLDYAGGIAAGLDSGAADPVYGWLLYGSVVVVLLGLVLRRAVPVILGHALLGAWYAGLGWASLDALHALPSPVGWASLAVAGAGVWLLLAPRFRAVARLAGLALMLGGQAILVADLAADYRTGTGLVSGGFQHATLAVGTFVLWQRQRLRRLVDDEES